MASRLTVKQSKKDRPKSSSCLSCRLLSMGSQFGDELYRRHGDRIIKCLFPGDKKAMLSSEDRLRSPEAGNTLSDDSKGVGLTGEEVLRGEDISSLAVDLETFRQQHAPRPPTVAKPASKKATVLVRRTKTLETDDGKKSRLKTITVARSVAHESLPLQSNRKISAFPRFDEKGTFVRHSVLGTLEDYQEEAFRQTTRQDTVNGSQVQTIDSAPLRPQSSRSTTNLLTPQDQRALQNWNKQLLERKRIQGHISKLLQMPKQQLLMNKAEDYREVTEQRNVIDKAIAAVDYGKGYRVGSEFWRQHEQIGNDGGISMTLTETEKGHPPPIEHIGKPNQTQIETGTFWPVQTVPVNYPWKLSSYLAKRMEQLGPIMKELDPYNPEISKLQVIGSAPTQHRGMTATTILTDPLEETETAGQPQSPTVPTPVCIKPQSGPSLLLGGQRAQWEGIEDPEEASELEPIRARVIFENLCGQISTSSLNIVNDGTTAIYYSWRPVPKTSSLETCLDAGIQRFYFNTRSDVILPGRSLDFPFTFKSPNAGIFSETWQLETRPVLCRGAPLHVTLRGVVIREDKLKRIRSDIEAELEHRQAVYAVGRLVNELVDGIRTPPRTPSPLNVLITEEDRFLENNRGLFFSQEALEELKALWINANTPDHLLEPTEPETIGDSASTKEKSKKAGGTKEAGKEGSKPNTQSGPKAAADVESKLPPDLQQELEELVIEEWDLSIKTLQERILVIETDARREDNMAHLNRIVVSMSFSPLTASQQQLYNIGYELLADWVDSIVSSSAHIRYTLGLPEKSFIKSEGPEPEQPPVETKKQKELRTKTSGEKGAGKRDKAGDTKGSKRSEKTTEDRPSSKSKVGISGRRSRGGGSPKKGGTVPVSTEDAISTETTAVASEVEVSKTEDPVLQGKYDEQFYMQAYSALQITLDRMGQLFDDMSKGVLYPQLPR